MLVQTRKVPLFKKYFSASEKSSSIAAGQRPQRDAYTHTKKPGCWQPGFDDGCNGDAAQLDRRLICR
jgi:hypothetical protein